MKCHSSNSKGHIGKKTFRVSSVEVTNKNKSRSNSVFIFLRRKMKEEGIRNERTVCEDFTWHPPEEIDKVSAHAGHSWTLYMLIK
jgi:hypothetical protein